MKMTNRTSRNWAPGFWLSTLVLFLGAGTVSAAAGPLQVCELIVSISEGAPAIYTALFLAEDGAHFLAVERLPVNAKEIRSQEIKNLNITLALAHPDCVRHLMEFPVSPKPPSPADSYRDYLGKIDVMMGDQFVHPDGHVQFQIHRITPEALNEARGEKGVIEATKILDLLPSGFVLQGLGQEGMSLKTKALYFAPGVALGIALFFALALAYNKSMETLHLRWLEVEAKKRLQELVEKRNR